MNASTPTLTSCLSIVAGLLVSSLSCPRASATLPWPGEWVVLAPLERHDEVLDPETLATIPEVIELPALADRPAGNLEARRVAVEPGKRFDLDPFFDDAQTGKTAYVFLELDSPAEQTATLGIGADWWVQVWLNGEEIFDTLETGNPGFPPTILDNTFEAALAEGGNVLAIRFIRGNASGGLAVGGPDQFPAARARRAARREARGLNVMPEQFEDRLLFPVDTQALVMAERGLELPRTDADLSAGDLAGLQPMPERQLYLHTRSETRGELLDTVERRLEDPVFIRLSKFRYPWEDRHLDAMVWTTPEEEDQIPQGRLEVLLKDREGEVLASHEIGELSPNGLFFSVGFPEALQGNDGVLEVIWRDGGEIVGQAEAPFQVLPPSEVADSGRVPIRILNQPGAVIAHAPMTVGVPFPRGALSDENQVRLVDEEGGEIPLQTRTTAKWSRFGPVKWLLCDFTVNLDGEPREVYLEYGPGIARTAAPELKIENADAGAFSLDTGRLRVTENEIGFDPGGEGDYRPVLAAEALRGAFVTHEDGKTYVVPAGVAHAVEEWGGEKAVIRRTGWYVEPRTGEEFCQFVTRLVFHRESPVVRIFHTWIFTGDGNSDRIANMGWRFDTAGELEDGAILVSMDDDQWTDARALVQFDYQEYLLLDRDETGEGRAPGVMSAKVGGNRVTFGTKDFWQNFPSELAVGEDSLTFYNWPRHNPPATFERPVAPGRAFRHRFAHEGEVLDFRIPDEYAEGEIWRVSSNREGHIAQGRPESVNAQGIARTEEMFLYFTDGSRTPGEVAKVMQGLNDETLRAVADPKWMAASGVFGNIHPYDPDNYPEEERLFELTLTAPARWVEQLGFYGMWLHGDYPTWDINLRDGTVSPYRTLRKNHHDYPYRWAPFARSGDPRMLKLAENAARQMTDANFCHYATADIDAAVGPDHFRRQGWWDRSLLPWAGRDGPHLRSYTVDSDYLWHTYYLTGYARARDVALLFGELTQHDHRAVTSSALRPRITQSMMPSYLDMYEATFDPWFLASAHEISDLHLEFYRGLEPVEHAVPHPHDTGHTWRNADQRVYLFTGSDEHRHVALNNAKAWSSQHYRGVSGTLHSDWGGANAYLAAFAWSLTGDDFYLGRVAAAVDAARAGVYEGDVEYSVGLIGNQIGHGYLPVRATKWDGLAQALFVLDQAGERPEPLHSSFQMSGHRTGDEHHYGFQMPPVFVKKTAPQDLPLYLDANGRGRDEGSVWPDTRYEPYNYHITGPDTVFSGTWRAPELVKLPPDAPEGVYQVDLSAWMAYPETGVLDAYHGGSRGRFQRQHAGVYFPIADAGTPEVMRADWNERGTRVGAAGQGFYFKVPEDVTQFWIEFHRSGEGRAPANRATVWNPDGQRAWDLSYSGDPPERVLIEVSPEYAGKIWRATGGGFTIDPIIPPYFSVTSGKWFNPEE